MKVQLNNVTIIIIVLFAFTSKADALNWGEIFWAGESTATFGEERIYSVLGLAVRNPPLEYSIEPWIDDDEYSLSYKGLTVNTWNTDYGLCDLYSNEYVEKCFDCFSLYDTKYVLIQFGINDILSLAKVHGGDVDIAVNNAIALIERIQALGKTVIWITSYPLDKNGLKDGMPYELPVFIPEGAGDFGQGETHCTAEMEPKECGKHWNSNHEYFIDQLRPWCADNNVGFIDLFQHIRDTYGDSDADDFVEAFSKDGLHINYPGSYIIYSYIRLQLEMIYLSDPDNDGNPNCSDNCPYVSNMLQEDEDEDGRGNACDNCPYDYNPEQDDTDGDCIGNACDTFPEVYHSDQPDSDSDGTGDICDNCPTSANANQENRDGDEKGDACDDCPNDPGNDIDGDLICGDTDNCPSDYNPLQEDSDGSDIGDVCNNALDLDGDEWEDNLDNCPNTPNPNQLDTSPPQGNGIGDACDCEADFNCNGSVDALDVTYFLWDFGRSSYSDPCTNQRWCYGDFNCDGSVVADDVSKFLEDFGRNQFTTPCPACVVGDWCVYP